MKFEKEFRKEHPETLGETDRDFDRANYIDWLEQKIDKAQNQNQKLYSVAAKKQEELINFRAWWWGNREKLNEITNNDIDRYVKRYA